MKRTLPRAVLGTTALLSLATGLWLAFTSSPDVFQADYVRIMYVHVPGSWLAFLAFGVTALASAGWLVTKRMAFDRIAEASAEIGVLFTAVSLFTGMLWGYPVWGTFWDWGDPRMASTALMFFVYLGYLALRRSIPDPTARARRSAILGLIAVVQVPLVYFSVTLWRSLHQGMTVRPDGIAMDGSMVAALLVNLAAFSVLYIYLMVERVRLARLEAEASIAETELAGQAVAKPNLEGLS
ncbi:MAG: cytochrome c biogenesis protein CcsA [Acidimicrobiia bacterium]